MKENHESLSKNMMIDLQLEKVFKDKGISWLKKSMIYKL